LTRRCWWLWCRPAGCCTRRPCRWPRRTHGPTRCKAAKHAHTNKKGPLRAFRSASVWAAAWVQAGTSSLHAWGAAWMSSAPCHEGCLRGQRALNAAARRKGNRSEPHLHFRDAVAHGLAFVCRGCNRHAVGVGHRRVCCVGDTEPFVHQRHARPVVHESPSPANHPHERGDVRFTQPQTTLRARASNPQSKGGNVDDAAAALMLSCAPLARGIAARSSGLAHLATS